MTGYRFAIDRGGTFTDVVAETPGGRLVTLKLLSDNPGRYDDAASEAVRRILAEHGEARVAEVRIGTTIATNALLERKGEPLVLAITRGFGDALRIGTQARPDIFARHIVLPEQLPARVVEIDERVGADGAVLRPLDEGAAREAFAAARAEGFAAIAIVLMHGWGFTAHEARLAELAREAGFSQVSASHEVAPLVKLVPRGDTTVADAYLSPIINSYVRRLDQALHSHGSLRFMQSSGGLADARAFRGKDAILSGPAGGVVGMAAAAPPGYDRLIGFDMGGTSTDVCHYAGEFEMTGDRVVAGVRIAAPMMQIHTIAAGGGSVCRYEAGRFQVGPQSAGADPGPACYRKGGPLTVTDCNLFLGRIDPGFFPAVFGPGGGEPLDREAARARLEEIAGALPQPMALEAIAEGFLDIAVDAMAGAIRKISSARGHDVTRYALACFGGAGGQHACRVADSLGIETVLVHPLAGMLSAYGIGLAPVLAIREASVVRPLGKPFAGRLAALEEAAVRALVEQGIDRGRITLTARARLRFGGSDTALTLPVAEPAAMEQVFRNDHRLRFGYSDDHAEVILEALSVEASGRSGGLAQASAGAGESAAGEQTGPWRTMRRGDLPQSGAIDGPALIVDPGSTTVVEAGWRARLEEGGSLILTRAMPAERALAPGTEADPVRLEIFNNLFMAIAEEMGVVLEATASSVNIKERLDFSCALFDARGALIANAPHIPVHLGSMGESIRRIIATRGGAADGRGIRRGDAYVLNDPYNGGTHLPDITVIVPVFYREDGDGPEAFVAARGHHADIGGISPGSMPPFSTAIGEEGVLIDNLLLVDEGRFCERQLREALASGEWPARDPDRNVADLKAQLAACSRGAELLRRAAAEHGAGVVASYMEHVLANAEESVRRLLDRLVDGEFAYAMDNGAEVRVALRIDREARSAVLDFTGTSAQLPDNFNAPRSITRAAALYALRTLIDEPIPLNDGCLRPVELIVPPGSMLDPVPGAAVVAGNVETSQVVTEAILAATGMLAPGQGTMNNFTFGDARLQYYETIAGGSGAGPGHDGTSAVQTHMTNSRLTDPEVLEMRFPVRVERFAIRRGSGGVGAHAGGDGVEREIRFLEPMRAMILAGRRKVAPRGLAGGGEGAPGENWVERADGTVERYGATASVDMEPGDVFVIRTPGGGGFGEPTC
jgi:5-oxoprolinase (ATP-hydrolysing)